MEPDEQAVQAGLRREFLELAFTETEATKLAAAYADPDRVAWWLQQGCSHTNAVKIAT